MLTPTVRVTGVLIFSLLLSSTFRDCFCQKDLIKHSSSEILSVCDKLPGTLRSLCNNVKAKFQDVFKVITNLLLDTRFGNQAFDILNIPNEKAADIVQHPYQVSIEIMGIHICGGVILNKYFVLTAGRCSKIILTPITTTRVGSPKLMHGGQVHSVIWRNNHPLDKGRLDFDVALMRVEPPFKFSTSVQPVELVEQDEETTAANVTGWGVPHRTNQKASLLEKREVPILPAETCTAEYKELFTDNMICGGFEGQDHNTCTVEAGSPLVAKDKLLGVATWPGSCSGMQSPDVYMKITAVQDWIHQILEKSPES